MTNRRDLLSECVQPGTPVDVLKDVWCVRCSNPECVRSSVGTSKFDRRVLNWEEKLFKNPPILAPDDPRFARIVAQKFITIDPGRVPEIRSGWVDPRDLKEPEPPPIIVSASDPSPRLMVPEVITIPAEVAQAPTPSPPKPRASPRSGATTSLIGQNAPDQSGKVLRESPTAPTTKSDPWAVPAPPDPADEVVQPGATIKMGRSGV